ncbi:ParA family protein [Microbacterium sp. SL62]|uniref:ParA family protein n=1 Tax=Microbacterium sp. SL62 TaxID=2995139 RepID=UPI002272BF03|nr:ParA family protein [Microbacterium sp. SL62]MCY1718478.1 ParA family protein [Microbacterium sp. SL62]
MALDRSVLNRVIAVINGKGGVLKTTICTNTAGMLAASGYRVLFVDMDPQGNAAEDFGYSESENNDDGRGLAAAWAFGTEPAPLQGVRENLDVLVGGSHLEVAAAGLRQSNGGDWRLKLAHVLEKLAGDYDVILIDCPPGEPVIQQNALAAAKYVIAPTKADKSSRAGLFKVTQRFAEILDINPDIDFLGCVIGDIGKASTKVRRETIEHVTEMFGGDDDVVFKTIIRHSDATAQRAREEGKLVFELEKQAKDEPNWWQVVRGEAVGTKAMPGSVSDVAADLHSVAQEIIERMSERESEESR